VPTMSEKPFALARDIGRVLGIEMRVLFDVGANTGQTARNFVRAWPNAHVHCFEPVRSAHDELVAKYGGRPNLSFYRCAFGDREEVLRITARGTSTGNSILRAASTSNAPTEEVRVTTGYSFCEEHGIDEISLLKVDTEGYDLNVLRGFHRMLLSQSIDMVQVEAGMNPENRKHVPLASIVNLLEPMGYRLFRIYDQSFERDKRPVLRRCNPVFVSARIANRQSAPQP
jgi:FkbM family methyltransferase